MSMRQPRCLRKSHKFLIPVGPFMDDWGIALGTSEKLSISDKAEIVAAFFEGYKRQDQAFGYIRAYKALIESMDGGLAALEQFIPFDLMVEIKSSKFSELTKIPREEFEQDYANRLSEYKCQDTGLKF